MNQTDKPKLSEKYFAEIYTAYRGQIYNLVYRMTYSEEAVEDITQETFLRVFEKYDTFRGHCSLSTWIYAIARNLCFQHLGKAKKGSFLSIERLIDEGNDPIGKDHYDDHERLSYIAQVKDGCLLGLLRCLPLYQRIAFILSVLNGLSVEDISPIIGKTKNSTRILIHRGRAAIKSFLCRNCSLFEETNKCRCENLISFSLKRNWITAYNPEVVPEKIESELKAFKDEITFYRTLPDHSGGVDLAKKISGLIKRGSPTVFSPKKVK